MWFSLKLGFRAFIGFSRKNWDSRQNICPRAPEIHIFYLKSQFFREILKKARNPNFRDNHMGRPQEGNSMIFVTKRKQIKIELVARPEE